MNQISGEVQALSTSSKGNHSIRVNEQWFFYGNREPNCGKNDFVTFEYSQRGDFKSIEAGSLKIDTDSAAPSTVEGVVTSVPKVNVTQKVIQYQSARNSAIAFVQAMLDGGVLKLPAENKRVAFIEELVNKYTEEFNDTVDAIFYGKVADDGVAEKAAGDDE